MLWELIEGDQTTRSNGNASMKMGEDSSGKAMGGGGICVWRGRLLKVGASLSSHICEEARCRPVGPATLLLWRKRGRHDPMVNDREVEGPY